MQKNRKYAVYALYKGDEYIAQGTIQELAKKLKLKKATISFYRSPAYKKRNHKGNCKTLVRIEEWK